MGKKSKNWLFYKTLKHIVLVFEEDRMAKRFALGIDYGTESGRALLVNVEQAKR
jgi:hypothetical protein